MGSVVMWSEKYVLSHSPAEGETQKNLKISHNMFEIIVTYAWKEKDKFCYLAKHVWKWIANL